MNSKTVTVPNISCHHCVNTIENELRELKGVSFVKAEVESKKVKIDWKDSQKWENIKNLLTEINYPPAD